MKLALASLCIALCACDSSSLAPDATGADAPPSTAIGPAGGTLTADGVTITIPPGALATPTEITLEADITPSTPLPTSLHAITRAIRVQPHGLTFAEPVTISLAVVDPAAGPPSAYFLADANDSTWDLLGGAPVTAGRAIFTTRHFSEMEVAVAANLSGCMPGCTGGDVCVGGACVAPIVNPCGPAAGYAPNSPWPTVTGCETNRRRTFAIGPAAQPAQRWRWTPTVGLINQAMIWGPVIDGTGALYVISDFDVTKLATSGAELWRTRILPATNQVAGNSPPVLLADGGVLVCIAGQPMVKKLGSAAGNVVWTASSTCGDSGSLLLDGGLAIPAIAADGTIRTGGVPLSSATGAPGPAPARACEGSLVLDAEGTSYCTSGNQVVAVRADGTLKWSSNLDGFHSTFAHVALAEYQGTPIVTVPAQNGLVTPNQWISLYPLAGPGTTPNDPSVPHLAGMNFLGPYAIAANNDMVFENRGTGATGGLERWSQSQIGATPPVASWISSTPRGGARAPHPAPVIDGNGDIYYGSYDGFLISLSATGTERWRVRIGQADGVGNLGTPAIGLDGTIYIVGYAASGTNSYLYALRAP